jgi:hypothetical protein
MHMDPPLGVWLMWLLLDLTPTISSKMSHACGVLAPFGGLQHASQSVQDGT